MLHAALLLVLCLLALRRVRGEPVPLRLLLVVAALLGLAAWMHPSWYLYLLPAGACLLAGERRLGLSLCAALAAGLLIAGLLYGRPIESVSIELLPGDGSPLLLLGATALVLWRIARGRFDSARLAGPVPVLALAGWLLGWLVIRFWSDWGAIALLAWVAVELQHALEEWLPAESARRLTLALACSATVRGGRAVERPYLVLAATGAEPALPDPGGILYSDDMRLFFQLFYSRPEAPFRYMVGFEPGLMPPEDLATFRRVLASRSADSFAPWLAKMTPRDRLILISAEGRPPIPGLEWTQVSRSIWSGRLPRVVGR